MMITEVFFHDKFVQPKTINFNTSTCFDINCSDKNRSIISLFSFPKIFNTIFIIKNNS